MIFEILGARILWAYTGNSLFVWTSIIALILWALALGYYIWGELADKKETQQQKYNLISLLFLGAAFSFLVIPYISGVFLSVLTQAVIDIRISSLIGTLVLFVPASFVLGMIPPLCTKIHLTHLEGSGKVVGRIGSIGTVWSIFGTVAAGFFLIPLLGINMLLFVLSLSCIILSFINQFKKFVFLKVLVSVFAVFTLIFVLWQSNDLETNGRVVIESPYSHITISDTDTWSRTLRRLFIDNVTHSWMYLDGDDLFASYTNAYHLFSSFVPNADDVLMIGGAAYSFPKSFLQNYPEKNIDVIEIDPTMTQLAKKYFKLKDDERLISIHQDARVYLNSSDKKYDAILWDAFSSYYSIPFQLTTTEAIKKKYDMLTEDGVVILNMIWAQDWDASKFIHAQYLTYKKIFPEVFILPSRNDIETEVQNIILVAAKNPDTLGFTHEDEDLQELLWRKTYLDVHHGTRILTDNYAPVDYYISMLTH